MPDWFYGPSALLTEAQQRGRVIYERALSDRRGFRPDQIGIPTDDTVWLEIFHALATEARAALEDRT